MSDDTIITDETLETSAEPEITISEESEVPQSLPAPQPEAPKSSTIEDEARAMGWKPKEEFVGDPDRWEDAKQFVKTKGLFDELHQLRRKLKQQDEALKTLVDLNKKSLETTRTQQLADLKAKQREAAQFGDFEKVDQLTDKILELNKQVDELPKLEEEPKAAENAEMADPDVRYFVNRNPWLVAKPTDPKILRMQTFAHDYDKVLRNAEPGLSKFEHLMRVEAAVKQEFSDYFVSKEPVKTPKVESGVQPAEASNNDKYMFQKIPAEYKNTARYWVQKGGNIKEFFNQLKTTGVIQ